MDSVFKIHSFPIFISIRPEAFNTKSLPAVVSGVINVRSRVYRLGPRLPLV